MKHSAKHRVRVLAVFALLLLSCIAVRVNAEVLFYAGYDGTADAVVSADDCKAQAEEGTAQFKLGKRGEALLSGEGVGYVSYDVKGNIVPERGSVEMWVSPVDWEGSDVKFHVFFEAMDPGWLLLYKYRVYGSGLFFLLSDDKLSYQSAVQDITTWKPGEWHHLVGTWEKREACLYVDGKLSQRITNHKVPTGLTGRFMVGDRPWMVPRDARSLVDEVYIYDRPLDSKEVEWAYQHALDRPAGRDIPAAARLQMRTTMRPLPSQGKIVVDVETAQPGKGLSAIARLEPSAGTSPAAVKMTGAQTGQAAIHFKSLPKGEYQVITTLKDASGAEIASTSDKLLSPGPAVWRGNKIGISSTPPPPWTPVHVTPGDSGAFTISVWGRTYVLGPLGLPTQIASAKENLLSAPISLLMTAKGKPVVWRGAQGRCIRKSDVQVILEGSAVSELGTLKWLCTPEYDGTLRYDLELQPSKNASADKIELRFPVKPERSTLNHMELGYPAARSTRGAIPMGDGTVYKANFVVQWWLGDEERGLAGFCESDQAWDSVDREDKFRLDRTAQSVDAVWAFNDKPLNLDKPWKFTFGLEATPVKDMTGWRKWRLTDAVGANVDVLWTTPEYMPYFGYPQALNPEKYKTFVDGRHAQGLKLIPYSNIMGLGDNGPEYSLYGKEWENGIVNGSADGAAFANSKFHVCSPSKDFTDFMVWGNNRYVRSLDLDGLYHDWTGVWESKNQLAGCGYVRDGAVRDTYPVFATRELYKRMYTMLKAYGKEKGKETFTVGHMSSWIIIPIVGFCDAGLDGEHLQGLVKDTYLEAIPLDQWRAEFMGHNWGVIPLLLPQFTGESQTQPGPTNNLMGLTLLHDSAIWPSKWWMNTEAADRVYRAMDEFGMVDAQFLPYWNNSAVIGGQTDAVKTSAYRHPKGGSLVCIMNLTNTPQSAALSIDWDSLKSPAPLIVVDAFTKTPANVSGKNITIDIPPLDFALLWVK